MTKKTQLQKNVKNILNDNGYNVLEYHSEMEGDKAQTLAYFEKIGGIIIAIKCLDEGVDIPNVTHALILASSKNPREFIQRRGRILRLSDNKPLAYLPATGRLTVRENQGRPHPGSAVSPFSLYIILPYFIHAQHFFFFCRVGIRII